jgi:cell division protease FtsH
MREASGHVGTFLCLPEPAHSWHRGQVSTDPQQRDSSPPGLRQPSGSPTQTQPPDKRPRFRISWWWIALVIGLFAINYYAGSRATRAESRVRVPYSPFFLKQVTDGNVKEITSKGTAIQGTFTQKETYKGSKPTTRFKTEIPTFADTDALSRLLQRKGVVQNAQPLQTGAPWWENLLLGFGPTLLFLLLLVFLLRRAGNVQGMLGAFGRSRARRYEPSGDKVTFADVAGIDEAKEELAEVVDFLRNPEKYRKLGGRIPHGVLLSGPPGTGKTLLARAVAGEANVPFFSLSASEFVEAIVGIGASRVRDLFAQAKEAAPAIVFIDELDAIGRSRTSGVAGFSGGNDEREQTLNQILTEMDGFDSSTSVIVIGATNRPDVLDQALLRPGRFDRRVSVQPPDRNGREQILKVHTRGVPLGPDVDLGRIAATAPGMVGADLANLVNEAALLAARRDHKVVTESDFTDALERIVLGAERQVLMSPEDKRRTAYHEGGHAIVGMLTPGADPVRKISIIPRGVSLGVTFSAPDADRYSYERRELEAKIKVALGGRSAEEIVYNEPTTGAESDIQQLTEIARQMVGRWGMSSKIGPVAVTPVDGRGPFLPGVAEVSPHTQELIDAEVRRIVEAAHGEVVLLLKENRDKLDSLAAALLEHETLDEDEAYAAAHVEKRPERAAGELAAAARTAG